MMIKHSRCLTLVCLVFTIMYKAVQARYSQLLFSAFLRNCHHHPLSSSNKGVGAFMMSSSPTSSLDDGCPLEFELGPYAAAEVKMSNMGDNDDFLQKLDSSIAFFRKNDFNSLWLHVPITRASIIERLAESQSNKANFRFDLHHTNQTTQTIVLKKWLKSTEDKIPPFATHQVGCAGFVLNDKNEILLIKEWSGPSSNRLQTRQWKLPGGLLDAGETFEEATCREVLEETGIETEFESLLTFWHRHGLAFGKSDMYFVCLLKPKSLEINACPVEVSAAGWMSVDEFLETQDHPLITHVLQNNFNLDATSKVGNAKRIVPSSEMMAGSVQWPNRHPYPTYTSATRK